MIEARSLTKTSNMIIELVEKDKALLWDSFVLTHPDASPYHLFAWQQAVTHAYTHKSAYFAAFREGDKSKIIGVLPLIWIKPPLSSGTLCALPFCDVAGCLAYDDSVKTALLDAAFLYAQQHSISGVEHRHSHTQHSSFDLNTSSNSSSGISSEPSSDISSDENLIEQGAQSAQGNANKVESINLETIQPAPKVRMLMDFPENSDALMKGFKSKLRSQIRKAEKNGLTSSIGNDTAHLEHFYQVFARNMRDLGSPVHSKAWFEALVVSYGENLIIANVFSNNQIIGAGIVLFCGDKACIPWASTNSDYNHLAPNMLLYWTLLAFSNDNGCKQFDFGRSTLGEGTYKFKKQWGAKPQLLIWDQYNQSGVLQQSSTVSSPQQSKIRHLVETTWKKLPVKLTVFIGPKIRKYISL